MTQETIKMPEGKPLPTEVTFKQIHEYIQEVIAINHGMCSDNIWYTFDIRHANNHKRYRWSEPEKIIYVMDVYLYGLSVQDVLDFDKPVWSLIPQKGLCTRCYRDINKDNYKIDDGSGEYCKSCYDERHKK